MFMTCGLPEASSLIVTWPVRIPVVVGLKVTATVQLACVARPLPQVLVWLKSPLAAIPEIFSVTA
jgi:vacuolar-type H+-ATPase catalytic subunit A/Vma1